MEILNEVLGSNNYIVVAAGIIWGILGILIISAVNKKSLLDIFDTPKDRLNFFMQVLLLLVGLRFCNFIIGSDTVTAWGGFLIGISTERIYSFIVNYRKENIKND